MGWQKSRRSRVEANTKSSRTIVIGRGVAAHRYSPAQYHQTEGLPPAVRKVDFNRQVYARTDSAPFKATSSALEGRHVCGPDFMDTVTSGLRTTAPFVGS